MKLPQHFTGSFDFLTCFSALLEDSSWTSRLRDFGRIAAAINRDVVAFRYIGAIDAGHVEIAELGTYDEDEPLLICTLRKSEQTEVCYAYALKGKRPHLRGHAGLYDDPKRLWAELKQLDYLQLGPALPCESAPLPRVTALPAIKGVVLQGIVSSPGFCTGRLLFNSPHKQPQDFKGAIFCDVALAPHDIHKARVAAGSLTIVGAPLDHAQLTLKSAEKPSLLIPSVVYEAAEGQPRLKISEAQPSGLETTLRAHEGDILHINGYEGTCTLVGAAFDPQADFRGRIAHTFSLLSTLESGEADAGIASLCAYMRKTANPEVYKFVIQQTLGTGILSREDLKARLLTAIIANEDDIVTRDVLPFIRNMLDVYDERIKQSLRRTQERILVSSHISEVMYMRYRLDREIENFRRIQGLVREKLLTAPHAFETQMRNIQMHYANKMEAERINIISRLKDFEQRLDAVENHELGTLMRLIEQTRILQTYITYQGRGVEQLFEKVQGKIKRAREGFFASRRASDYIVFVNTRGIGSFLSESMGPKAAEVAELFNLSLDDVDIPPGFVVIRAGIEHLIEANRQQADGQERLAAIEQMIAAPMSHREKARRLNDYVFDHLEIPLDLAEAIEQAYHDLEKQVSAATKVKEIERLIALALPGSDQARARAALRTQAMSAAAGDKAHTVGTLIEALALPKHLLTALRDCYREQGGVFIVLRSSSIYEDTRRESMAGRFYSQAYVRGRRLLWEHIRRGLAYYWLEMGQVDSSQPIFIHLQREADVSMVVSSINIMEENWDQVAISATHGPDIVSGEIPSDLFVVDANRLTLVRQVVADKTVCFGFNHTNGYGLHKMAVGDTARRHQPALTSQDCITLARVARRYHAYYGYPIEFEAVKKDGRISVVQVRPIVLTAFVADIEQLAEVGILGPPLNRVRTEKGLWAQRMPAKAWLAELIPDAVISGLFNNHLLILLATRNHLVALRSIQYEIVARLVALEDYSYDDARRKVEELFNAVECRFDERDKGGCIATVKQNVTDLLIPELKARLAHLWREQYGMSKAAVVRRYAQTHDLATVKETTVLIDKELGSGRQARQAPADKVIALWADRIDTLAHQFAEAFQAWRESEETEKQRLHNDPHFEPYRLRVARDELHHFIRWLAPRFYTVPRLKELHKPTLVLIAGPSGSGKSTLKRLLAKRLSPSDTFSTDVGAREGARDSYIETLGETKARAFFPELFSSSFSRDTLEWYYGHSILTLKMVKSACRRLIKEGSSAIIEGVPLIPGLLSETFFEGANIVWIVLTVQDAVEHYNRLGGRDDKGLSRGGALRYRKHIRTIRNCQARLLEMGEKTHSIIVDNSASIEETLNTIMRRVNDPIADRGLPVADAIRDAVQMDIEKRESQIRVSRFNGAWVTDIDDTLLESGAHPGQEWIDAQVAFIRKLQTLNIVWVPMSGVAIEKAGPRLIYRFPKDVCSHVIYYGGDGSAKLSYDLKSEQWLEDQAFLRHFSDAQAMAIIGEKALAQALAARLECPPAHERVQNRLQEARAELASHRIEGQKGIIASLEARLAAEGFPTDAAVTYFRGGSVSWMMLGDISAAAYKTEKARRVRRELIAMAQERLKALNHLAQVGRAGIHVPFPGSRGIKFVLMGNDKERAMRDLLTTENIHPFNVLFMGNELQAGGNDACVKRIKGVTCISIGEQTGPQAIDGGSGPQANKLWERFVMQAISRGLPWEAIIARLPFAARSIRRRSAALFAGAWVEVLGAGQKLPIACRRGNCYRPPAAFIRQLKKDNIAWVLLDGAGLAETREQWLASVAGSIPADICSHVLGYSGNPLKKYSFDQEAQEWYEDMAFMAQTPEGAIEDLIETEAIAPARILCLGHGPFGDGCFAALKQMTGITRLSLCNEKDPLVIDGGAGRAAHGKWAAFCLRALQTTTAWESLVRDMAHTAGAICEGLDRRRLACEAQNDLASLKLKIEDSPFEEPEFAELLPSFNFLRDLQALPPQVRRRLPSEARAAARTPADASPTAAAYQIRLIAMGTSYGFLVRGHRRPVPMILTTDRSRGAPVFHLNMSARFFQRIMSAPHKRPRKWHIMAQAMAGAMMEAERTTSVWERMLLESELNSLDNADRALSDLQQDILEGALADGDLEYLRHIVQAFDTHKQEARAQLQGVLDAHDLKRLDDLLEQLREEARLLLRMHKLSLFHEKSYGLRDTYINLGPVDILSDTTFAAVIPRLPADARPHPPEVHESLFDLESTAWRFPPPMKEQLQRHFDPTCINTKRIISAYKAPAHGERDMDAFQRVEEWVESFIEFTDLNFYVLKLIAMQMGPPKIVEREKEQQDQAIFNALCKMLSLHTRITERPWDISESALERKVREATPEHLNGFVNQIHAAVVQSLFTIFKDHSWQESLSEGAFISFCGHMLSISLDGTQRFSYDYANVIDLEHTPTGLPSIGKQIVARVLKTLPYSRDTILYPIFADTKAWIFVETGVHTAMVFADTSPATRRLVVQYVDIPPQSAFPRYNEHRMRLVRDIIGDTLEVAPEQINVTLEGVLTKERIGRALSNAELIDKAAGIINGLTYVKNLDEISHLPQKSYAQQAEMIVRYGAGCHMQYLPAEQVARALKRFCHANDTLNRLLNGECHRLHLMEFVPDEQYDQTVVKRRFDRAVRRGVAQGRFCLRHGSIQPCEPVQS
jgi:2-phosphoglycerate kinase